MKFIAYILIVSMGLLGLNRIQGVGELEKARAEMSCNMDCCCSQETSCCEDPENSQHESDEEEDKGLQCTNGCGCDYSIHVTAMAGHIQNSINLPARTFDYGANHDHYFFEYLPPHFQPPRQV